MNRKNTNKCFCEELAEMKRISTTIERESTDCYFTDKVSKVKIISYKTMRRIYDIKGDN